MDGAYLGKRYKPDICIMLYQIEDFYIEVYFHQKNNNMVGIASFLNIDNLEPYLEQIDISSVFELF